MTSPTPGTMPVTVVDAHKTLLSIGLMIVVMIVLIEASHANADSHDAVLLLLVGGILLLGVNLQPNLSRFTQTYPWNPPA